MNSSTNCDSADLGAVNERVQAAIRAHRIKVRVLSALALILGGLALATSLVLTWGWRIKIRPVQNEMMREYEAFLRETSTNPPSAPLTDEQVADQLNRLSRDGARLTYIVSAQTGIMALAVGSLALGALVLIPVVILTRRVALHEIEAGLAEISQQLRELSRSHPNISGIAPSHDGSQPR